MFLHPTRESMFKNQSFFDQATVLYSEVPAFCRESRVQYQAPKVFPESFKYFFSKVKGCTSLDKSLIFTVQTMIKKAKAGINPTT